MARVQGVKEKLHAPIYDAFRVEDTFEKAMKQDKRMIRFFVDVQGKTKLETNLQASGVLPSHNTFEARALRVIASPPGTGSTSSKATIDTETFVSNLIYNSVVSLIVGEKVMIEMPTFWFPSGAGVFSGNGAGIGHGQPDPMATFRFAEPVIIEPHQNFRVEMLFPHQLPQDVAKAPGEFRVWVVVDGYLTRDVQ